MTEILCKDEVYTIIGAAMDVYNELGNGFLEAVYQEALELELKARGIPFEPQKPLLIYYRSNPLSKQYVADLIAYGKIIVEIKAMSCLSANEEAQILNYLKATKLPVGLLINFGSKEKLEFRRFVM